MFTNGEYLDYTFDTKPEPLSAIAEIAIEGDTIEFRGLALYCRRGEKRVLLGVGTILLLLRALTELTKSSGYNYLVITGDRHTGANPGRDVLLRRKLR